MEESSEFLEPVDTTPMRSPNEVEDDGADDDYQTLERIKSVVHPPYSATHFSYNRVPWTLRVRKEIFSPSETINSPLAINLIFCQVSLLRLHHGRLIRYDESGSQSN